MTAFEEMGVLPEIGKAVEEMDWMLPTDVQSEAIPAILGGGDVLMAAETGSGKTGAFCLPVLQIVYETLKDIQMGKMGKGGGGGGKAAVKTFLLNMYDRNDAMAITPEGLLCQSRDPQKWHGCRATNGVAGKGRYYYEATVTDDGLCRVGWSTMKASLDLGTDKYSFGFGGTGKKSYAKRFDDYGESFCRTDVIGCFLDLDKWQIKFSKNGKVFPVAFDIPKELYNDAFYPAVVLKNAEMSFNFGASPFSFAPEGWTAVCETPKDCLVPSMHHGSSHSTQTKPKPNATMCIVIEPSRELAEQTYAQFEKFKKHLDNPVVNNVLVIGGVSASSQISAINAGVHIITGTPGRLEEFIDSGQLCLSQVRFFILDECDGLLSAGYLNLIKKVHNQIPKVTPDGRRLQMVVCSATLHNFDVKKLANELMHFPQWVDLKGQDSVPETVHHVVVMCDPKADKRWIRLRNHIPFSKITEKILQTDQVHARDEIRPGSETAETLSEGVKRLKGEYVVQAIQEHKMDQSLIFCRTKIDCDNLEHFLKQHRDGNYTCVCLHGDRRPDERKRNLQMFKDRKVRFLICTDVAARGIDIRGMPYVINVTLPDDKLNYLHRIGRVGRAERMGLAISLVSTVPEKVWYHQCPSRGKNCNNTRLTDHGGCTIWYNEPQLLSDIEEHLGCTVQQVEPDIKVPLDEFDGKVVYGAKRRETGGGYKGHANILANAVAELRSLEKQAQSSYLTLKTMAF